MSALQLCRICLRTDFTLKEINGINLDFYKELGDISNDDSKYLLCSMCEHLLRKAFNFKKICQKSNKILQQWRTKNQNNLSLSELYKYIPPSPLQTCILDNSKDIHLTESGDFTDVTIKVEKYDPVDENNDDLNKNYINNINEVTAVNDDNDVSDDDRCLIDYIKERKHKVESKTKKSRRKSKKIKIEDSENVKDEPKKKLKQRRPLKDQKEYETVFDIKLFTTEDEVRDEFAQRQMSEHYLNAKYRCEICYTVYKCEKLVNFHMKWHDPSAGGFPCDICAMRFKTHVSMRKHKTDVHFGRFQCKRCPLLTYHKMVMILHYRKHQGVSYACKICKRTYNHSSTYMSHLRKSHPSEHVCVCCAQTFVSEKGLNVHRKKVHFSSSKLDCEGTAAQAQAQARCDPCDVTFASQQVYIVHIMNTNKHKDIADTLIACPECGLQFNDKMEVRAHRRQLHPQYNFSAMKRAETGVIHPHTCPLCGVSGTHNTWLYRHFKSSHPTESYEVRVRSERRKHLCDQCGKSFYNITQLREHAYSHSGLKPFRCERCPAAFRSKSHLKFHSERHLPASRPCTSCGKKFVSAANLSNHMRSHIGDRRYKCSLCDKGFLHCAALREHIRGVHLHIRRQRNSNKTV